MNISNLLTITPVKSMWGKRTGEYRAEFNGSEFCAVAPTKELAVAKLQNWIGRTSKLDFTPRYFRSGEYAGLVWSTPHGVCSAVIHPDSSIGGHSSHALETTLDIACRSMRAHLAQLSADVTLDDIPPIIADDSRLVADYVGWRAFQRAYLAAPSNCPNKHAYACEHSREYLPERSAA